MQKVTHDLLGIVGRLKQINPAHTVYYNNRVQKFEIHNITKSNSQPSSLTYAFSPPYDRLDCRTLDYAYQTRIQNLDTLEKAADKHNKLLNKKFEQELDNKLYDLTDMLAYANRTGHDVAFNKNIFKEF